MRTSSRSACARPPRRSSVRSLTPGSRTQPATAKGIRETRYTRPMQRLFPDPGRTSVTEAIATLDFADHAHDERPYLFTNFVLTLDGRATLEGRSGPIGSDTDTAMLVGLRT